MLTRLVIIVAGVLTLVGLIAFSKFRAEPNHVSGFIEADEIRLGSRVGGRVRHVYVQEGQRVEPGQVLVSLQPYDLLERAKEAAQSLAAREADHRRLAAGFRPEEIAQAKARYDQLQAKLDLLEAGPRPQEIEAAKSRLVIADAELKFAKQNFDRQAELFQRNAVSREEFDRATERFDAAQATVIMRREELELLELGTREEEIRQARAQVEEAKQAWLLTKNGFRQEEIDAAAAARDAAQAALEVTRAQIAELEITSPVEGVVEALELQAGDLVPAGGPVLSMLDDRHLWVRAYVPQNRVGLHTGERLRVKVDSYPDDEFVGEVTFISRQSEFTPANVQTPEERAKQVFRIKVTLENGHQKLRPGMAADVWLEPVAKEGVRSE
jgi:multidrug resistance efflux pump